MTSPFTCEDCGRATDLRFVPLRESTFDSGPLKGEKCKEGIYLCKRHFEARYPLGEWVG